MKLEFFWLRGLPSRTIVRVATLGPIGQWRGMPGTYGTLAGILLYITLFYPLNLFYTGLLLAPLLFLTAGFCDAAEDILFRPDPGEVILDEAIATPLCFLGLAPWMTVRGLPICLLLGFLLFRIFDIVKPFGISRLQRLPGGWGILADDLAAALATCLCLHLLRLSDWWPLFRFPTQGS